MTSTTRMRNPDAWREVHHAIAAYLDTLPSGWASYPDCRAAGTLFTTLRNFGAFEGLCSLPEPIERIVGRDLRDDEWLSEIEYVSTMLAILDCSFAGNQRAFLEWASEVSGRRMARAIEPAVLSVSADVLLANTTALWNRYHRGSSLTVVESKRGTATTRLEYPVHLFPPVMIDYFVVVHEIALTRVDAALPRIEVSTTVDGDRAVTLFAARWQVA